MAVWFGGLQAQTPLAKANEETLRAFLASDTNLQISENERVVKSFVDFCSFLKAKKTAFKNEKAYLKFVFLETQAKFLKKYAANTNFARVFQHNEFNCVSATMLYALIMRELDFKFNVKELPFHVYLLVNLGEDGLVMLESTIQGNRGFIEGTTEIENTEKALVKLVDDKKERADFERIIIPKQLLGLQYYNEGLAYFQQNKYEEARQLLQKASKYYVEDRIESLLQLSELYCEIGN